MRTTITLEEDALAMAKAYAKARALNIGQAVSELIRRGSAEKLPLKKKDGVWVFALPADAPHVSARKVQRLLDESA